MVDLSLGAWPNVNFERLDYELRAALPGQIDGISQDKFKNLTVHVSGNDAEAAEALRGQIETTVSNHNPLTLTPAQALAARRLAAKGAVGAEDFASLLAQINAATSLADAKPILRKFLALNFRIALAQGMTDAEDLNIGA